MTANESKIYGALLTLASLMVIVLVVMGAPVREKVKCEGYNLGFIIEDDRDTFRIGDPVSIVNTTNNINSLEWLISDLDSIVVGKSMREQSIVLVFNREGQKNIQLRINDNEECTTVVKRIFIMPHCSDGQQNGSETEIDCGGNCPPCEVEIANTPPPLPTRPTCYDGKRNGTETGIDCGGNCTPCAPPPINNLPYASIVRIAGEPICQTAITFDCGIPPRYQPTWSFDDTGSEKFSGTRITHKFRNEGVYTIRVYIGNTQVGHKRFNIGSCSGGSSPYTPPPTTRPPATANIILPTRLNCKEVLTFRSTSTQASNRLSWQINGVEKTGANFYHTFEEAGTYTVKLYSGSNYSPADTRTFTITCNSIATPAPPKSTPSSDILMYPILKTRFQGITDEAAKAFTIVPKSGPKYQRILGDPSLCNGGKTKVKINNNAEKSLDRYFRDLIDTQYIIDEVKVKKKDNCIDLILITHHKK